MISPWSKFSLGFLIWNLGIDLGPNPGYLFLPHWSIQFDATYIRSMMLVVISTDLCSNDTITVPILGGSIRGRHLNDYHNTSTNQNALFFLLKQNDGAWK